MANKNIIKGFEPYGELLQVSEYVAAAALYPGDLVKLDSDGKVAAATAGAAAAIGVVISYAASGANVLVADHPNQKFICQANGSSIDAQTDMNLNYNISVGTASTLYRRSAMQIDHTSGATNSNYQVKVLAIHKAVDNALGDKVDVICVINNHSLKGGTGSDGI